MDMFRYKRVRQHETTASLFHMWLCGLQKEIAHAVGLATAKTFFKSLSQTYTTTPGRLRRYDTWDPTIYKIVICGCVAAYDGHTRIGQILQYCYKLGGWSSQISQKTWNIPGKFHSSMTAYSYWTIFARRNSEKSSVSVDQDLGVISGGHAQGKLRW